MEQTSQQKGTITELHCILDFMNLGYRCLKPIDEGAPYDIVVDIGGSKFIRIQCKTAKMAKDVKELNAAFAITTYRQTINTKSITRYKYTKDDVDYFYTWFAGNGYLISIGEATGMYFRLRYEYPCNNQHKDIHIAKNYEIGTVMQHNFGM